MTSDWNQSAVDREDYRHTPGAPDSEKKWPGKKNRRRWCKGKVGIEHDLETRLPKRRAWYQLSRCMYSEFNRDWYICYHEIVCKNCGKVIQAFLKEKCPDFTK